VRRPEASALLATLERGALAGVVATSPPSRSSPDPQRPPAA